MTRDDHLSFQRPVRVLVLAAIVAAAIWTAWLCWDNSYYRVPLEFPDDDGLRGPYTTAQVLGYAITLIAATVIAAARWNPVLTGIGMFTGTWIPFTIWAVSVIGGSTVSIGIMLSAIGMSLGAALFSYLGYGIARLARRTDRGRATV